MDKNKNRIDMLAAGRKKLQQFRQKKDGKGSKTSGKSSKSDLNGNTDEASIGSKSAKSGPNLDTGVTNLSTSVPQENLVSSDIDVGAVDQTSVPVLPDIDMAETLATTSECPLDVLGANQTTPDTGVDKGLNDDSSPLHAVGTTHSADPEKSKVDPLEISEAIASKGTFMYSVAAVPADYLAPPDLVNSVETIGRGPEMERVHGEDQEVDGSGLKQVDRSYGSEPEAEKSPSSYGLGGAGPRDMGMDEATSGAVQPHSLDDALTSLDATNELQIHEEKRHSATDWAFENSSPAVYRVLEKMPSAVFDNGDEILGGGGSLIHKSSSTGTDLCSMNLYKIQEGLQEVGDDGLRVLLRSRAPSTQKLMSSGSSDGPEYGYLDFLGRLKEQLYLTNCAQDIFHLELAEQSEVEVELNFHRHQLLDELSMAMASLNEVQVKNESLAEELAQCRSELEGREEVQKEFHTAKMEAVDLSAQISKLQIKLERSEGDLSSLSSELADCRSLMAALQGENEKLYEGLNLLSEEKKKLIEEKEILILEKDRLETELMESKDLLSTLNLENANMSANCMLVTQEREKIEKQKEHFEHETEKLNSELMECKNLVETLQGDIANLDESLASLSDERDNLGEETKYYICENEKHLMELAHCKDSLASLQVECSTAVNDLKEATTRLEQLTEENVFLKSSLDLHKVKLSEFGDCQLKSSSRLVEARNQVEGSNLAFMSKESVYDDSLGFVILERHLKEAEKILQKFEKAVEGMHSHSISLARSSSKVVSPGVSKLIHAFESQSHRDNPDSEEMPAVYRSITDSYMLTKEQAGNLRAVLKEFGLDTNNASKLFKGERKARLLADSALMDLKDHYEALKKHSNSLEEENIELLVLREVTRQQALDIERKKDELGLQFEALKQQDVTLEGENTVLGKKVTDFEARINALQGQLDEFVRHSEEMVFSMYSRVEALDKVVVERSTIFDQEWNYFTGLIVQAVKKLDASIETCCSTVSTKIFDGLDVGNHVATSVDAATKVIEDLQEKLRVALVDHEAMCSSYADINERFDDLCVKNQLSISTLHQIYSDLQKLVNYSSVCVGEIGTDPTSQKQIDPLDLSDYDALMEQLGELLGQRLQLETLNSKLNSELVDRTHHIDELNNRCLCPDVFLKLIADVEQVVELKGFEFKTDDLGASLELLISFLVEKYREVDRQINLSREEFGPKETELSKLHRQVDTLTSLIFQQENESLVFKESLRRAEENCVAVHSELQEKVAEIQLSEQRVSSLREKLSIAVSKGKGLIVQRDSLKQTLAETSAELEKCSHEIQSRDARLQELEMRLKTYSEAGERIEALESELSYIRNSATALRESFLLKDSVLQKIEEILEDLELPEHFHSGGIIEKVNWLARSVSGSAIPLTDWDQQSHMGGGSYSDAGFVVMDSWKEDAQLNSNSGDDLRRNYEELQNKFYGLAEQNEMLEQSLMERNNLVQRWEEILDRIDMPSQFKSLEPEERIAWLGAAVSEAQNHCDSLQQQIDKFDTFCQSLTTVFEESEKRVSDLEAALQSVMSEKEYLSDKLDILTKNYGNVSQMAAQFEVQNDKLQNEAIRLQEKLDEKQQAEGHVFHIEGELRRLQDLLISVIEDPGAEDLVLGSDSIEYFEKLLRKLIEKYRILVSEKHAVLDAIDNNVVDKAEQTPDKKNFRDSEDARELDVELKKKLEDTLDELMHVKESRELYKEKNQFLLHEVEALEVKRRQLEELLNQEEQKSASVREKLNVAVRKGKSLVQQRDGMKQIIDEVNSEVEQLKSELQLRENSIMEYEQKIKDLSAFREMAKAMESNNMLLSNHLAEAEHRLQENMHIINLILNALGDIDVGSELNTNDPVEKVKNIGRLFRHLQLTVTSSEHESRKSKRAAELLLAELNEVQERNDALQEELAQASSDISELSKEKDLADVAKCEAVARLDKLSAVHAEERNNLVAELSVLKSAADQLRKAFLVIENLLGDVLSKDLELLHNLEASMKSHVILSDALNVVCLPTDGDPRSIQSAKMVKVPSANYLPDSYVRGQYGENFAIELCSSIENHLQAFTADVGALREKLYKHSSSFYEEANRIMQIVMNANENITFKNETLELMKTDIHRLESIEEEKRAEAAALHRNFSLLYEACHNSVMEMESWKAQLIRKGLAAEHQEPSTPGDGVNHFSGHPVLSSEDCVRTMADKLLSVVKDLISMQIEIGETGQKEMKIAMSNLQKELQEKDIQRERICMELVNQIKDAEAAAKQYLQELQSAMARVRDLERQLHVMEEERIVLHKRVKQLQEQEATSVDLHKRVESLTEVLDAKDHDIEGLTQALDEEERQMEDLSNKIVELESVLQQKNVDLEKVKTSHGKALKKLSVTVSKFDELHCLSESLLSEVEKLQSQVQDKDAEISFLRQEVTRCTNDALVVSQMSNKRNSDEIHELLIWLDGMIPQMQVQDLQLDDIKASQPHEYKEMIQKQIMSVVSELEDLRVAAQNRDRLLQIERSRVEELTRKEELLENSLLEKHSQLNMLRGVGGSEQAASTTSEIVEVEPVINQWKAPGTSVTPQVRSLRKANNDQVAIAIDMDQDGGARLEDEDDDKAHGFKSLTTSRVVPRFTRPVTDMIDGLWVSCDRALMRQPALRLGVIIYWAVLHALLATFVV